MYIFLIVVLIFPYYFPLPYVKNPINDQIIEYETNFDFKIPDDTFRIHECLSYDCGKRVHTTIYKKPPWMEVTNNSLVVTGSLTTIGYSYEVFVNDTYAFIATGVGLKVVNVANKQSPILIGSLATSDARGIFVLDNYAYIADYEEGLKIIDVSNKQSPILKGSIDTERALGVFVVDNYAYVADWVEGFKIIDVTDKQSPIITGIVKTNNAQGVFFSDNKNFAYLADGEAGFKIIDVTNKQSPVVAGSLEMLGLSEPYAHGVFVLDNYAYIADYENGLKIINVSNSFEPILIGSVGTDGCSEGVFVSDGYAYVSDCGNGISAINVKDKESPVLVGSVDTMDALDVFVLDNFVYVADGRWDGIKIICIEEVVLSGICNENGIVGVRGADRDGAVTNEFGISCKGNIFCNGVVSDSSSVCNESGICVKNGTCVCFDDFYGVNCEIWECFGILTNYTGSPICNRHGECISPNDCECENGYTGDTCASWFCYGIEYDDHDRKACSNHGTCDDFDTCSCAGTYHGLECNENIVSARFKDQKRTLILVKYIISKKTIESTNRNSILLQKRFECSEMISNYEKFFEVETAYCSFGEFNSYDGSLYSEELSIHIIEDEGNAIPPLDFTIVIKTVTNPENDQVGVNVISDDSVKNDQNDDKNNGDNTWVYIIVFCVVVPLVLLLLLCVCLLCSCVCLSCLFVFCLGAVASTIMMKQRSGINKFRRLKDFDILLTEQMLEEEGKIVKFRMNKDMFKIPFDEVKVLEMIGQGGSEAIVFKAVWQNRIVAFKCFKTRRICGFESDFRGFEKEVEILSSVSHPSIIRFFGCSLKEPRIGIVMEFCSNGDLLKFLGKFENENGTKYPFKEKYRMILELVSAFVYLHSRSIIHRDLKCENILVDENERVKVMDFGLSRFLDSGSLTKSIGTPYYIAPEMINSSVYNSKCDVFSFGITCWVMTTENPKPYGKMPDDKTLFRVANNPDLRPSVEELEKSLELDVQESMKDKFLEVVQNCWSHNPHDRMTFSQVNSKLME